MALRCSQASRRSALCCARCAACRPSRSRSSPCASVAMRQRATSGPRGAPLASRTRSCSPSSPSVRTSLRAPATVLATRRMPVRSERRAARAAPGARQPAGDRALPAPGERHERHARRVRRRRLPQCAPLLSSPLNLTLLHLAAIHCVHRHMHPSIREMFASSVRMR